MPVTVSDVLVPGRISQRTNVPPDGQMLLAVPHSVNPPLPHHLRLTVPVIGKDQTGEQDGLPSVRGSRVSGGLDRPGAMNRAPT